MTTVRVPAAPARAAATDVGGPPPGDATGAPARPGTPARRAVGRRLGRVALAAVVPTTLLVAWYVATTVTGAVPAYRLPEPAAVLRAGRDLAADGALWTHVLISTQRVLLGFAAGSAAGLALGAVVGLSSLGDRLLSGTVGAVRAVPSLAWVPLLIVWLKLGEDSKVTLVAIGAFFPVYTTVSAALRHVDHHLVEAGRAYGLHGLRLLVRVQLPAATPGVVAGLRLALAQSWLFLVAAELAGASMGLGFLLTDSQNNGRTDRMILAIVVLAVLGKATDSLIGVVERRLLRRW